MPGPDIATKAPENDAAEESAAGGTEAQLCDDCVTDRPTRQYFLKVTSLVVSIC